MPDRDWWQALWPHPEEVVKSIGLTPEMTAIDLCCGDGYFTIPLAHLVARVYGLELDGQLLEVAAEAAAADGSDLSNLVWVQGDAMAMDDLIPEAADCILIANTIHGVQSKHAFLDSIAGKLKCNGLFAVINWHKQDREETQVLGKPRGPKTEMRMSPEELTELVSGHGFTLRNTVPASVYHYLSVYVKKC